MSERKDQAWESLVDEGEAANLCAEWDMCLILALGAVVLCMWLSQGSSNSLLQGQVEDFLLKES